MQNKINAAPATKQKKKTKTKIQGTATVHTKANRHLCPRVFTTHTITTQGFTAGSTFGSKLSDNLVQYIKQINTYIYSTYRENKG